MEILDGTGGLSWWRLMEWRWRGAMRVFSVGVLHLRSPWKSELSL